MKKKPDLEHAIELLYAHTPVAIPTETVYGLAALYDDEKAIQKVFDLKQRPADNPLIVHISNLAQLNELVTQDISSFNTLFEHFWPGPLSLIFRANTAKIPAIVRADLDTVAIRMPNHPLSLALIEQVGPLVAPSANPSGYPSPTSAQHVLNDYHNEVYVLDGGICLKGLESTILDVHEEDNLQIVRPGVLGWKEFESLGFIQQITNDAKKDLLVRAPGMKHRHYAPLASVEWISRLEDIPEDESDCLILSVETLPKIDHSLQSKRFTLKEYDGSFDAFASDLYANFREADERKFSHIYILRWELKEDEPTQLALLNRIEKAISRV